MKVLIVLCVLFLLPCALAQQANQIYGSSGMHVLLNVSSSADIVPQSSSYSIEYVTVNLTFLPKGDTQQKVLRTIASPRPKFAEDSALFTWNNPSKEVSFFLASEVETNANPLKVTRKVKFPLEDIGEYYEYTLPTENIDSDNEEIIKLASEIAAGEDDEFVVVSKIAQWSQENVEYNLSTLTADVSQKASWVLRERQGVCDELTNLFIAMNRALGIPARFVSGVSYTDSPLFADNWGLHGWAEVYFPGVGWVPFDVTYGQFGYVDPAHIKLRSAIDVANGHTLYSWKGRNIDVMPNELKAKADIVSIAKAQSLPVEISINVANDDVGFGSYNLVEARIKNLRGYYVSEKIIHARTVGLQIKEEERNVILKPFEDKKEFFLIRVEDDQNKRFIYTYPLLVYSTRNITARAEFRSSSSSPVYPEEYFAAISDVEQKQLASSVQLACSADKKSYYIDEQALVNCIVKNNGNVFVQDLDVCLETCKRVNIGITQSVIANFSKQFKFEGPQKIIVTAKNSQVAQSSAIETNVQRIPNISIAELRYPKSVKYDDEFAINFLLDRTSSAAPLNTRVLLQFGEYSESWQYDEFSDHNITFSMSGKDLNSGMNSFSLEIDYQDARGRAYSEDRPFAIELAGVTFFQKIAIFLRNLFG